MKPIHDLRLHHIGHAVREIEAAAALYESRFGYVAATPILHDPLQTAFVQFFRIPGNPAYLELVAPDSSTSKLAGAIKNGCGLNHLCYTTDALEAEIARLEAAGMKLISEPKPAVAFAGRRICWLLGTDRVPMELVERRTPQDSCEPCDEA